MRRAIQKYGVRLQLDMVIEECAELIQGIQKFKRFEARTGVKSPGVFIIEEAVDVALMLDQVKLMFPGPLWDHNRARKLARLKRKLRGA